MEAHEQVREIDDEVIEAIAERLAQKLMALSALGSMGAGLLVQLARDDQTPIALLTVEEKAARLQVSRGTVYRNARRLGGRKVSPGKTAAWRFPADSTLPDDPPHVARRAGRRAGSKETRSQMRSRRETAADRALLRSRPRL